MILVMGEASREPSMEEILASIKRIIAEDGQGAAAPSADARKRGPRLASSNDSVSDDAVGDEAPAGDSFAAAFAAAEAAASRGDMPDHEEPLSLDNPIVDDVDQGEGQAVADHLAEEPVAADDPPAEPVQVIAPEPVVENDPVAVSAPRSGTVVEPSASFSVDPDIDLGVAAIRQEKASPAAGNPQTRPVEEEVLELTDRFDEARVAQNASRIVSEDAVAASRSSLAALSALVVKPEPSVDPRTLEGLVTEMLRPMLKEWLDANLPDLVEKAVSREVARITGRVG